MERHDFASDNVAGATPEVLAALNRHGGGFAPAYGDDAVSRRAKELICALLDVDAEVRFVPTGTAANALSLAALAAPHEAVIAHAHSHVATDETGAPGLFGAGMGIITVAGASGRIEKAAFLEALSRPDDPHWQSPAAASFTNATEYGTRYREDDLAALFAAARGHGLKIQIDGARMANAAAAGFTLSTLGSADVVVLGGTKAGATPSEALVLIDPAVRRRFGARLKHGGQLVSKARFLAAPWIGMLETGAWTTRAAHANAMAARLASLMPFPIVHPVEANSVFADIDEARLRRLRATGWFVYRFLDGSVRFMCSWATTAEAVDEIAADLRQLV